MKKYRFPLILVILAGALLLIVGYKAQAGIQPNDIYDRLKTEGVPVKSVDTIDETPYRILITLQSSSKNQERTPEDSWYMAQAIRVAYFYYRTGVRVDSFKIVVANTNGEIIDNISTQYNPQDPAQNLPFGTSKLDNRQTEELVTNKLVLGGLGLVNLNVSTINSSGDTGQILIVKVSAKDLKEANQYLPTFFASYYKLVWNGNSQFGTYIVLAHLQLVDPNGVILLEFDRENEAGVEFWLGVPGLWNLQHVVEGTPSPSPQLMRTSTPVSTSQLSPVVSKISPTIKSTDAYPPPPTPTPLQIQTGYPHP